MVKSLSRQTEFLQVRLKRLSLRLIRSFGLGLPGTLDIAPRRCLQSDLHHFMEAVLALNGRETFAGKHMV